MPRQNDVVAAALAAALLLAGAPRPATGHQESSPYVCAAQAAQDKGTPVSCCFAHPRYVGVCEVRPSHEETCASILDYLNNPQSQGKAYCGNTSVRGDWAQVSCEKK